MYITNIDAFVYDQLILFLNSCLLKNKNINSLINDSSAFLQYKLDLQSALNGAIKNCKNILKQQDGDHKSKKYVFIIELMTQYFLLYSFCFIIFYFKKSKEMFTLSLNKFCNSLNTTDALQEYSPSPHVMASILQLYDDITQIKMYIKNPTDALSDTLVQFLDHVGSNKSKYIGTTVSCMHNINSYLIFNKIYMKQDRQQVLEITELVNEQTGEFKDIYVVVQNKLTIDYDSLEQSVNQRLKNVDIEEYFELLNADNSIYDSTSIENKVKYLFEHKIITPITHDFLRIHKDDDSSAIVTDEPKRTTKFTKNTEISSKIKKIVERIERLHEHRFHPDTMVKLEKYFPQQFEYKYGTVMNYFDELKVLKKMQNMGGRTALDSDHYKDLMNFRKYAFVNFKHAFPDGFKINLDNSVDVMRYVNILNVENNKLVSDPFLLTRLCNNDECNVGGVAFINPLFPIECCPYDSLKPIIMNESSKKHKKSNRFLTVQSQFSKHFKQLLSARTKYNQYYWLFDSKLDLLPQKGPILSVDSRFKRMLAMLYDQLSMHTIDAIMRTFLNGKKDLFSLYTIIHTLQSKLVNVNKFHLEAKILSLLHDGVMTVDTPSFDLNEDNIIHNIKNVIPMLSVEDIQSTLKSKVIKYTLQNHNDSHRELNEVGRANNHNNSRATSSVTTDIKPMSSPKFNSSFVCQHVYELKQINTKKMTKEDTQQIYQFYKKYMTSTPSGHICKSCGELLDIKHVNIETIHRGDDSVLITNILTTPLEKTAEYSVYWLAIININKMIEIIASRSNFTDFYTNINFSVTARRNVIKNVIDLIDAQYHLDKDDLQKNRTQYITFAEKQLGIPRSMSLYFLFPLKNDIFKYEKNQEDALKDIKFNNIVCHVMVCLLTELSTTQMLTIQMNKQKNLVLFEKVGAKLFKGIYIFINTNNDAVPILNYNLLCFVIFHMCVSCVNHNIARFPRKTSTNNTKSTIVEIFTNTNIRKLINTVISTLNRIILINQDTSVKKMYLFDNLVSKFFSKLSMYSSKYIHTHLVTRCNEFINITVQNKITFNKKKTIPSLPLQYSYYIPQPHNDEILNKKLFITHISSRSRRTVQYNKNSSDIDSLLCTSTNVRNWVYINHNLVDILSNQSFDTILKNQKIIPRQQYMMSVKRRIANYHCIHGGYHERNNVTQTCDKCKKPFTINRMYTIHDNLRKKVGIEKDIGYMQFTEHYMQEYTFSGFSDAEIDKVYDIYCKEIRTKQHQQMRIAQTQHQKHQKRLHGIEKYNKTMTQLLGSLQSLSQQQSQSMYLDAFIDSIQSSRVSNMKVNLANNYVKIKNNSNGYPIDDVIVPYKKSFNKTFKRMVYSVLHKDIMLYYDYQFKQYLGFQEKNKQITLYKDILKTHKNSNLRVNIFVQPLYSFKSMLQYIGYSGEFIPVSMDTLEQDIISISLSRMKFLQNLMNQFKLLLFSINFKHKSNNALVKKYISKFDYLNITHTKKTEKDDYKIVFESWQKLMYLQLTDHDRFKKWKESTTFVDSTVMVDDLIRLNLMDIVPHYCFIKEIDKLLRINDNAYTKHLIISLFYDFIKIAFESSFKNNYKESVVRFATKLEFFDIDSGDVHVPTLAMNETVTNYEEDADHTNDEDYQNIESPDALDIDGIDINGNNFAEEYDEYSDGYENE